MADTFKTWSERVVKHLRGGENEKLFQEAIDSVQEEYSSPGPTVPYELLAWMRGDEPEEAFENGDSPEEYADFLVAEWDLYGPRGE